MIRGVALSGPSTHNLASARHFVCVFQSLLSRSQNEANYKSYKIETTQFYKKHFWSRLDVVQTNTYFKVICQAVNRGVALSTSIVLPLSTHFDPFGRAAIFHNLTAH